MSVPGKGPGTASSNAGRPSVASSLGRKKSPIAERRSLFDAACRSWFRVDWEGLENIPSAGGALLVSNHAGMFPVDGGIVQRGVEDATGRPVFMLAHHGFFRVPFAGNLLNRSGVVVAHPDNAHRLLADDDGLVVVFPEGEKGPVKPLRERYRLQRFGRGGFVETAASADVPIVPIVLMGTEDTTPTVADLEIGGRRVPLTLNTLLFGPLLGAFAHFPAKIRARALSPIQVRGEHGARPSRSAMMDVAEAIRSDMQGTLDAMLEERESIWFG